MKETWPAVQRLVGQKYIRRGEVRSLAPKRTPTHCQRILVGKKEVCRLE